MCRRNIIAGWCVLSFGLGLMVGHYLESWFLCSAGGLGLVFLGLWLAKQK